jgi:two-component system sensor histidine kinase KdpD
MTASGIDHFPFHTHKHGNKLRAAAKNLAVTIGIMTFATLLSFLFRSIGLYESNFIMAYLLGVLLVAKQTDGFFYGILSSVIGVLAFNFFFTVPYYSFAAFRSDYPVTFVIMLIAALITSTLTTKAKQEARLSLQREKRTQILYQMSKSLLKVRNIDQTAEAGVKVIAELLNRSVIIAAMNSANVLEKPYIYAYNNDERAQILQSDNETRVLSETFKTGRPMGAGTARFADSSAYYLPIKGQSGALGVVGISCFDDEPLSDEQKTFLKAVATQIALAMERERMSDKQQESKMEVERERLRGNLLRAMSHDLRTPLTGILGATTTILDHGNVLDKDVQRKLLQSVHEDASWLMDAIENILAITRMDEGKVELKKTMEAVEEVVAEAVSRMKLTATHTIKIRIPDELIMLPMDGILIEQVLVNLLDNAVKYTPDGSTVEIKTRLASDKVVFEVSDNGNGIAEEDLPFIFNRFYTTAARKDTERRGTGLGLAICKSVVTAHGGEISAFNNPAGGATFKFELPAKEG